jgi:hypothetical protein
MVSTRWCFEKPSFLHVRPNLGLQKRSSLANSTTLSPPTAMRPIQWLVVLLLGLAGVLAQDEPLSEANTTQRFVLCFSSRVSWCNTWLNKRAQTKSRAFVCVINPSICLHSGWDIAAVVFLCLVFLGLFLLDQWHNGCS